MKNIYLGTLLIVLILSGCTFGVDSSATPQNVYKSVMKLYRQNYAYIHDAPKSPDAIYDIYWPRVANLDATDEGWQKLAQVFADFEDLLKDEHIQFEHNKRVVRKYTSRWSPLPTPEEKVDIFEDLFAYKYGQVKGKKEIGYILVKELSTSISALERVGDNQSWLKKIDPIIKTLKSKGVTKMILDIRSGAGGSQSNAEFIVSRFMNKNEAYMVSYDLIGPADNTSNYKREVIYFGPDGERFSGKVVLLMDSNTGSGGEVFVLAASKIPGVKSIGTNTGGLPGTITVYDLPNYWTLQLTTSKTYPINSDGSDGKTYLTVGIEPDIREENLWGTPADNKKDEILERGIAEIIKM